MVTAVYPPPGLLAGQRLQLTELPLDCAAHVLAVTGDRSDPVSRRLADLGFLAGTLIVALRRAPLGDPTIYRLRNYQLSLRRAEADRIVVQLGPIESSSRPVGD